MNHRRLLAVTAVITITTGCTTTPQPRVPSSELPMVTAQLIPKPTKISVQWPELFVGVGSPKDRTRHASTSIIQLMRTLLRKQLRLKAPRFSQHWPIEQTPTRAQLREAGTIAFGIVPIIERLKVETTGNRATISCALKVRIGPWEGSDAVERWVPGKTAQASGRGMAIGQNTARAVARSKSQCVLAVLEQIAVDKIIPFLDSATKGSHPTTVAAHKGTR